MKFRLKYYLILHLEEPNLIRDLIQTNVNVKLFNVFLEKYFITYIFRYYYPSLAIGYVNCHEDDHSDDGV